jgi:electron transfer flavoprotein alpha subunit
MVAVVIEADAQGGVSTPSIEVVGVAQELGASVTAVVCGPAVGSLLRELASFDLTEIVALEHAQLEPGATLALVSALTSWTRDAEPSLLLAPHSYSARDYMPRLASRLERPLATDCQRVRVVDGQRVFTRPIFQGKLLADVVLDGPSPHLATLQCRAMHADTVRRASAAARVSRPSVSVASDLPNVVVDAPFREVTRAIDLARVDRIVAVGRGIQEARHLELIRELASALGAEVAASRPVCDAGWLPMDRQIGSSGQTVAPRLYVAVGISGAIQHIVGMKGAQTIVAINKDARAPIFEIADYGVVGDLFEIVPALVNALQSGRRA